MTATATRLPAGLYVIDAGASRIGFEAALVLGLKVKGHFDRYESLVRVGATPTESSLTLTVWTDSVRTGIAKRDQHLRAGNVLAVDEHPTMAFRSTRVIDHGDGYDVEGLLTVRGTVRPVSFRAEPADEPGRYTARLPLTPGEFGVTRRGTTKALAVVLDIALAPRT